MKLYFRHLSVSGALASSLLLSSNTFAATSSNSTSFDTQLTQQQIQAMGLTNVHQLLEYLTGFNTAYRVDVSSQLTAGYRGQVNAMQDIAVYLDGIRLNTGTLFSLSEELPLIDLNLIDSIRFQSGGQSAKAGSGAGLGALYITSKKSNEFSAVLGEQGSVLGSATVSNVSNLGEVQLQLSVADKTASNSSLPEISSRQLYMTWQKDGASLRYLYMDNESQGGIVQNGLNRDNFADSNKQWLQGQYHQSINKNMNVDYVLSHSKQDYQAAGLVSPADVPPFGQDYLSGPDFQTSEVLFSATLSHDWRSDVKYQAGVMWQNQELDQAGVITTHLTRDDLNSIPLDIYYQGGLVNINEFQPYQSLTRDIETVAIWGSGQWQIDSSNSLKVASRLTDYQEQGTEFSYQVTFDHKLSNDKHVAAQLSNGFRQASFWQLFVDVPATLGDENLSPVSYQTAQVEFSHTLPKFNYSVTGFVQSNDEAITQVFNLDTNREYVINQSGKDATGVEGQIHWPIKPNVTLKANASHLLSGVMQGGVETDLNLNLSAKLGNFNTGATVIYQSYREFTDNSNTLDRIGDVWRVNMNMAYQLGRSIHLDLALNNLTDEKFAIVAPQLRTQQHIAQPGRYASLSVNYTF